MNQRERSFDNLFNADHRNMMIEKYGWSDSMSIKLDDLQFLRGGFATINQTQKQWLP